MRQSSTGIALKLGATLSFSLMYAVIKLAGDYPVSEIVFFRTFFALVPVAILSAWNVGSLAAIKTERPLFHILRSIAGTASMFLNFAALARLPLADITGFGFVAPIFAVILAALILHERAGPYRWAAVMVGFGGVLLMIEPHGGVLHLVRAGFSSGAALALMGAALSAIVVIFIRQMSTTERSEAIVFYFMLTCAVVSGFAMLWNWKTPTGLALALLILSGLLGGVGQLCMTFSYRYAEPSLLAPFDYVAMLWAVALGFFLLGEVPQPMVMLGAAIVVVCGLFIVWRERRLHLAGAEAAEMAIQLTE
ncbi:MAG TPA: DMT family transporter [Rhizomicrobium sp.]|jgi:drug/metabolite transporter (DMT)-like permease|nr:DMT family transporter [Rhizomicrobium sp.]